MSDYLIGSGGKRIRPMLLVLVAKACGYEGPRATTMGCVVEYIHTATLLHDDVVDDAEMRRGNPSANAKWNNETSVLVGDFLFAKSFSLMAADGDLRIIESMSEACTLLSEGEVLQLVNMYNLKLTEEEYLDVIYRKTAAPHRRELQSRRPDSRESAHDRGRDLSVRRSDRLRLSTGR